jgi:hypothetical protein
LAVTKSQIVQGVNLGKLAVLERLHQARKLIELQQAADDTKRETLRARKRRRSTDDSASRLLEAAKLTLALNRTNGSVQRQIAACRLVASAGR